MLLPSERREPREPRPQSPQLTLRVAALGAVAVVLFAVLFFRLWVLQVLSAESYKTAAVASQLRTVRVAAPRGRILDARGTILVENRPGDAITFDLTSDATLAEACRKAPPPAPPAPKRPTEAQLRALLKGLKGKRRERRRAAILRRYEPAPKPTPWRGCARSNLSLIALARLTKSSMDDFEDRIHTATIQAPFEPVTLISDVPGYSQDLIFYLKEHGNRFHGIRITKRAIRSYPNGELAAHLYGQIGQVTEEDLTQATLYPGAESGDVVGHSGIERFYDRWLRGVDGTLNVVVDAQGDPQGQATLLPAPAPGRNVRLTLDARIQAAAEQAITDGVRIARSGIDPLKTPMAKAAHGAIVVMDVHTGAIKAMASNPAFDPNRLVGHDAGAYLKELKKHEADAALVNRAANGIYPPGSTFKPVTAIAALQTGLVSVDEPVHCGPTLKVDGQIYRNFETETNTDIALRQALAQSCDTYFYELGHRLYIATSKNGKRQPQPEWMRRLGFGETSGLDIPDSSGVAPDAAYKLKKFGRKDLINSLWTSGDAVNASIGQGFVQVTPLQLATLYALIANGGTLVTPHVGMQIEDADGRVVKQLRFPPRRKLDIEGYVLETIRSGLRGVTHELTGTAWRAFAGFPVGVAGKTGTAQKPPLDDYSWFVGYAPIGDPNLVAVCVIEQGGLGGVAAATAVREVLGTAFGVRSGSAESVPRDLTGKPIPRDDTQMINGEQFGDFGGTLLDANGRQIDGTSAIKPGGG